ncbi:MAG TPA: hydrogenase maturation protease [Candidatus Goldiibacteriota bacterium]|nr:hydrogenase maturation protease [Candidatus Goldiibacteriota bacterium]
MSKTLILGLGNSILSDDRIGLLVAEAVYGRLNSAGTDLKLAETAGMDLINVVKDYDNLIVIDSIKTGKMEPGEVVEIMENQNASSRMLSSHDVSFFEMLKMGKVLGLKMPQNVKIYGIEIKDNETFSEELTDELKEKLPEIINEIYLANRENLQ